MTSKSDYFFLNLRQLYPNFNKPAPLDVEIWEETLEPFKEEDIRAALKTYRQSVHGAFVPTVAQFKDYLYPYEPRETREDLPLSPESYLMEQDIKKGRCRYFYPDYARAVAYVLDVKVKESVGEEAFKKMTRGMKYRTAVDNGLFADFDDVLDLVVKEYRHEETAR